MQTQYQLTIDADYKERVIDYAQRLIRFESVTPDDAGCQQWIAEKLSALGATIEQYDCHGVSNLIAVIERGNGPDFAFCGHTDVVPAGNLERWQAPPFTGSIKDQQLIGRGIADMKGGIAAALVAVEELVAQDEFEGRLWFFITSDEEGEADHGSLDIVQRLKQRQQTMDYCLIGEPTAVKQSGDMIKVGRRGALSFDIKINGKSGHVAYPAQGVNAIHQMCRIVNELSQCTWDSGDGDFPGTTLQVTHMDSGQWTDNIIPSSASVSLNIRYTTRYTEDDLYQRVESIVQQTTQDYELKAYRHCAPYHSDVPDAGQVSLIEACEKVIHEKLGLFPRISTTGGTSDGRFFKDICAQVIELGLPNATIHQENERVAVNELKSLAEIYLALYTKVMVASQPSGESL